MTYMICRARVADFFAWKRVFDSHAEAQREAGLIVQMVLRNIDDANEVFMWFEVTDIGKARAFVTSPQVPDAQRASGVIEKPDIYFLS
jgi:hypothetical protein